jgi:hypothetical protein
VGGEPHGDRVKPAPVSVRERLVAVVSARQRAREGDQAGDGFVGCVVVPMGGLPFGGERRDERDHSDVQHRRGQQHSQRRRVQASESEGTGKQTGHHAMSSAPASETLSFLSPAPEASEAPV